MNDDLLAPARRVDHLTRSAVEKIQRLVRNEGLDRATAAMNLFAWSLTAETVARILKEC